MELHNLHKRYFSELTTTIKQLSNSIIEKQTSPVVIPASFSYTHNLIKGTLENVQGVNEILGYPDTEFTLQLYYQKLHPQDYNTLFESSKKGFKYLLENNSVDIFRTHLMITYRMMNKAETYQHILRITKVEEVINGVPSKIKSYCFNITKLNLRPFLSVFFQSDINANFCSQNFLNDYLNKDLKKLSQKECLILQYISDGLKSSEIAAKTHLSVNTIHAHRRNILKKMNSRNMLEVLWKIKEIKSPTPNGTY